MFEKYRNQMREKEYFLFLCSSRTETPSDKMMSLSGSQNSHPVSAPGQDALAPTSTEKNEVNQLTLFTNYITTRYHVQGVLIWFNFKLQISRW